MPTYEYKGRENGKLVTGEIEANTPDSAASQLEAKTITPISIIPTSKTTSNDVSSFIQMKTGVKLNDLIMFCRQMYSLTKAGVPIVRAITGLAENSRDAYFASILAEIASGLRAGKALSTCLADHPKVFSELFVNLISVGENTGQLDETFYQISIYLALEQETKQRIKSAFRYPIIVIVAIAVAIGIINLLVIPEFKKIFDSFDAELPLATRVLIAISDFAVAYWYLILTILIASSVMFISYIRTPIGKLQFHKSLLRIPVIGSIVERSVLGRFSRSMAVMLKAGVPIIKALVVVSKALGNVYVAKKIDNIREMTESGRSLTHSVVASNLFTPLVIQMIAVGEETGKVDTLLLEVAEFYEREVDYELKNLSSAIEPFLIVIIGIMVLILALGVFLPLWELSGAINN